MSQDKMMTTTVKEDLLRALQLAEKHNLAMPKLAAYFDKMVDQEYEELYKLEQQNEEEKKVTTQPVKETQNVDQMDKDCDINMGPTWLAKIEGLHRQYLADLENAEIKQIKQRLEDAVSSGSNYIVRSDLAEGTRIFLVDHSPYIHLEHLASRGWKITIVDPLNPPKHQKYAPRAAAVPGVAVTAAATAAGEKK